MENQTARQRIVADDDVKIILERVTTLPNEIFVKRAELIKAEHLVSNLKLEIAEAKETVADIKTEAKHLVEMEKDANNKAVYGNAAAREAETDIRLKDNGVYKEADTRYKDLQQDRVDAEVEAQSKKIAVEYAVDRLASARSAVDVIHGLSVESLNSCQLNLRHSLEQLNKTQKGIYNVK